MTTQRFRIIASVAAVAILLAGGGTWYALAAATQGKGTQAAAGKPVFRCPMHPDQVSDRAGNCPVCGMGLVPAAAEAPPSCGAGPGGGCCGGTDASAAPTK